VEIQYGSPDRAPRDVTLQEDADQCMLIFPLSSAWAVIVPIGIGFAAFAAYSIFTIKLFRLVASIGMPISVPLTQWAMFIAGAVFWLGSGILSLRSYLLYGHIPRAVSVNLKAGTLALRPERRARWRTWQLEDVTEIRVRPVRSLIFNGLGELTVRVRGRLFPLRLRVRGEGLALAERFAECVRTAVEAR
jgi:hypothetical protein